LKRKVLVVALFTCALASVPQARDMIVRPAYARDAGAPVVEMPPPSGEVQAPATSTISADTPAVAPPAPAQRGGRASVESANQHKDDSKADASDNSPFGGFQNRSNHGPINIKSDTMSYDYKNNVVVFSGKVHAVQADSELTSNLLHVLMNKQSQIQTMVADGNVRMSQGDRWATGDHAVLDENIHTLVLTGSPVVHDGKDQIAGTKITVFLQTNTSEVTDPKAVIFPRESKKPNNGQSTTAAPDQAGTPGPSAKAGTDQ
jgi:lipopolysaccharide export system protein LptA